MESKLSFRSVVILSKYFKKGFWITQFPGEPLTIGYFKKVVFILGSETKPHTRTMAQLFDYCTQVSKIHPKVA